jgi:hypothetical protein
MSSFAKQRPDSHEAAFLEPENSTKGAREENSFHSSKCNETCSKSGLMRVAPCKSPVSFVAHAGICFDAVKKITFQFVVVYISVNQEGVHFIVNIFHHNLESIKAMSLRILNLICKILTQVFIYNSVDGGEDLENVLAFRLF